MPASDEFLAYLAELLAPLGSVSVRRMFGGAGLFHGTVMFGIVNGDAVYLKASAESQSVFVAAGAVPFTYSTKNGRRSLKTFMSLPEGLLDEPVAFLDWAKRAMEDAGADADERAQSLKLKAQKLKAAKLKEPKLKEPKLKEPGKNPGGKPLSVRGRGP